jgi:DNA helicase-2/ATP-dependent DNA helicase PcrA
MPTTDPFLRAYAGLNEAQRKAVDTIDGPLMVIAGPGTGKTQVLALRVGNILQKTDVSPGNILCLTFTDAAAINMRERLAALIGSAGYRVAVHTFHGFASEIIREHPEHFYEGADFVPADELARLEILEAIFGELPRKDPLASTHEGTFTYLQSAKKAIGEIKKAGLTPERFLALIEANEQTMRSFGPEIAKIFDARVGPKTAGEVALFVDRLAKEPEIDPKTERTNLAHALALSLGHALKQAEDDGKPSAFSRWKERWTRKDDEGNRVLRDALAAEKLRSLARVYAEYQTQMRKARLFDFDDMLLNVLEAIGRHPSLRTLLQERFQYVLVDEFQDTNDAQLELVRALGSDPVHEGKPNIMIVGDDDQAIYRFQGAEISNIIDFPKQYAAHELVVLSENYRSTQEILDVAREVIVKGEERLERAIPALEKRLVASRKGLSGRIRHASLPSRTHEHAYIAREVQHEIEDGSDPSSIAIITRRHRELEDIAKVLVAANVPITYERRQNVFDEPHIRFLVRLARFLDSIIRHDGREADEYLPELLAAPIWGVDRATLWRISLRAHDRPDRSWLGAMREDHDPKVLRITEWLLDLAVRAKDEPLERILDIMIGSEATSSGDDDERSVAGDLGPAASSSFKSPFRDHYFGPDARAKAEARYLLFLSSLRVFIGALREYRHGAPLGIHDLVTFADLHERNEIPLSDTTPFASAASAVRLLTVHSAKGLEFDTVFVASCQEDVWAGRGGTRMFQFPMNLPIVPEDGPDDHLRIFYVALTRAKKNLYLSSYRETDAGKPSIRTSFLVPDDPEGAIATHCQGADGALTDQELAGSLAILPPHPEFFPIVPGERAILMELLKDYRMSVTHLNNFLDLSRGGPQMFLEQNLLRFPQAMSPHLVYGDAMHRAIEHFSRDARATGTVPEAPALVSHFRRFMEESRLPERERLHFLAAGEEALPRWWDRSGRMITHRYRAEVDFCDQGVVARGVPITGKIDKMIEEGKSMLVVDYKTGAPKSSWEGKDPLSKIRLLGYRRQLIFYRLLVEGSHAFRGYSVTRGALEFLEAKEREPMLLDLAITDDDVDRLSRLIVAVHQCISTLDFPDTSPYEPTVEGISDFEEALIRRANGER